MTLDPIVVAIRVCWHRPGRQAADAAATRRRPPSSRRCRSRSCGEAGGDRDDGGHDRHRPAAPTPRRITSATSSSSRARARTTARRSTASSSTASSRAATRSRRTRRSATLYGTGGLGVLKAEVSSEQKHTRGAVSPRARCRASRTAAASQFFICVVDQPALDGQYTVFARVVEGHGGRRRRSPRRRWTTRAKATERIEITSVTIRDKPPPGRSRSRPRPRRSWPRIARCSRRRPATSRSSSARTRRRATSATSCGWRPPASTTARRSTASCAASSSRPAR